MDPTWKRFCRFTRNECELSKDYRKLKIIVVNHRWVEDCVEKGRRVLESSYMEHCGLVIGPLLLEIPVAANEFRSVFGEASTSRSFCKTRVIDVESDDGGDDDWTRSSLLKEIIRRLKAPVQDEPDLPEGSVIEDHSDIDDDLDCLCSDSSEED
ncbi:BRCT domain-containing protein [Tanacetum coccineum]|uniref:BRCT domain-containing protein n=1 Tax=Tanacetum coccineum TaxID=301880 RepID=A0ABQ5BIX8_9ASTR